jgi:acetyl-CoA carboxylase biotin carboxyl carrier protein
MNPEELKQLKELIEFLKQNQIGEFSLEQGDLKVSVKFGTEQSADLAAITRLLAAQATAPQQFAAPAPAAPAVVPQMSAAAATAAPATKQSDVEEANLHVVKSPIVGTFYESPSPGASAFVKIGDQVENGQVLCIVEAMKLMNEIESDGAGEVVKRFVQNGQPVEYGQPLFALRTR